MESFGHLYIPMNKGTLFRDNFYMHKGDLYTSHFAGLGLSSPVVKGFSPLSNDKAEISEVLKAPSALAQVDFELWEEFDRSFKNPKQIQSVWPFTVAQNPEAFSRKTTKRIVLRSRENSLQKERIIRDAKNSFHIVRVAFSEDLIYLLTYLNRIKYDQNFSLELSLPSPEALRDACENELTQIRVFERDYKILTALESSYDIQARSKYLNDKWANFARATVDSLCALRAIEIFFREDHEDCEDRFSFNFFLGKPSFRGTITDEEIAYVNTVPWQPGMMGFLHSHRALEMAPQSWEEMRNQFSEEIRSMDLRNYDISDAISLLEDRAIGAINHAQLQSNRGTSDLDDLRDLIQAIRMVKVEWGESIQNCFNRIKRMRETARDSFRDLFYGLDHKISIIQSFAQNPSNFKQVRERSNNVSQKTGNIQIGNVGTFVSGDANNVYSYNNHFNNGNFSQDLGDFREFIDSLQGRYSQVNEKSASQLLKQELRQTKLNQPQIWQKFLNLKRIWKGLKQGSINVGDHFAEDSVWGKAALGFLEGVMDELED